MRMKPINVCRQAANFIRQARRNEAGGASTINDDVGIGKIWKGGNHAAALFSKSSVESGNIADHQSIPASGGAWRAWHISGNNAMTNACSCGRQYEAGGGGQLKNNAASCINN